MDLFQMEGKNRIMTDNIKYSNRFRNIIIIIQVQQQIMLKQTFLTFSHPIFKTNILSNLFFFSSKMANYASIPLHTSTESMWEYGDGKTPSNIKITAWNVNGIRSVLKKGEIQKYIQSSNPDIICLNQTKLDLKAFVKEKNNLINDFGVVFDTTKEKAESESRGQHYYWYWNFCKVSSGYSGVATLSKYKPIRAIQDFVMDHHMSLQGRCITLQYEKFYIVNCYKPNSGSQLDRLPQRTKIYDTKFTEFIKKLTSHKPVLICSDMNVAHKQIDIAKPKSNQKTAGYTIEQRQSFSKFLTQAKCVDAYRLLYPNKVQYTWWSTRMAAREKNIGWRIDYVLCSDAKFVKDVRIRGDVMGSDHCPVQAILQI